MKKNLIIILLILFVVVSGYLSFVNSNKSSKKAIFKDITILELEKMLALDYQFLDIRTEDEYNGIAGPKNIQEFTLNLDYYLFKDDWGRLSELDKGKPLVIICNSGNRSKEAMAIFEKLGFKEVYNVETGIQGWYNG